MQAEDVMTRNAVTIGAGASVREAARLLVEHRMSGLPVVDAASNVPGVKKVRNYLSVRSQVLPYVYWASEYAPDEDGIPPELRKDPWDPQDPTARP